jgi:YegS/Rv2252/BmrU family lipid kinase
MGLDAAPRIVAIVNPVSGAGMDAKAAERRVAFLRGELARRQLDADVHLTERAGHARELAASAAAASASLVIVWGGDGTLNEAASALVGTDTAIGLIPAGSGNGLAAALGVPRDPPAALELALRAPGRRIDAGLLGGRYFFNIAGIGVDARIAIIFNQRAKGSRGKWPYIAIGLREGLRYQARHYAVELDDAESYRGRALLVAFANGSEYGMGAQLAPRARLDDGLLDAFVIKDRSLPARFWDSRHLARGSVDRAPGVILRNIRRASIRSDDGPLEYHVDGEPGVMEGTIEVRVVPRALEVKA